MRQAVVGIGLLLLGFLAPLVLERILSAAPEWAWRAVSLAVILLGVWVVVLSDPVWTRLRDARGHPIISTVGWALVAAVLVGSAWYFFAVKRTTFTPMTVGALASDADYPTGTDIAGVPWNARLSELRVWLKNGSANDYEDLNVLIKPDQPVVAVVQTTPWPDVTLVDQGIMSFYLARIGPSAKEAHPTKMLATSVGFRLRCPRLPRKSGLDLVFVIGAPLGDKGILAKMKGGERYWFRRTTDERWSFADYFGPKVVAADVLVEGEYTASKRAVKIATHVAPERLPGPPSPTLRQSS